MSPRRIFIIASVVLFSVLCLAQEAQVSKPCIAGDEEIYKLGADGVNPPQLQPDDSAKNRPKIRGSFSFELVVNSQGQVCRLRVLAASEGSSAQEFADYITQHWIFKPATRQGRPVAVIFTANFNQGNPR